jgi:4,5-DOPA dioxygenase extradiol
MGTTPADNATAVTPGAMTPQPVLFVSHGATIFTAAAGDPTHAWLASLAPRVARANPRAIVVVSAHHVTSGEWAVTSSAWPALVHDHPVAAWYGERYAAPGKPALAARIVADLGAAGLSARLDPERGLDHGAWLPLRAIAPKADVPIVMVSLNARATFEQHVAVGAALEALRREGVLVLASGGVTHNQEEFRRRYFGGGAPAADPPAWSLDFDAWVGRTLAIADRSARLETLAGYAHHAACSRAHPTPEHFWPLIVATGAAGADAGVRVHAGHQHGLSMSAFLFGELPD